MVDFPVDKSVMLGIQDMRWMCRNVMAREKVLFPGHPVAAVAATTEAIAAEACALIEVNYEILPWSIEIEDAIKPDAPILHEFMKFEDKPSNIAGRIEVKKGDIAQGFAAAEVVIERTFTTRPVHQGYIEPHACLVSVGADNKTTIWSSSQGQFMVRAMTAYLTGIPQSDIRAIPAEIGGGFGGKTIVYLEPLATLLARKSGRPVKMVMTREEVMRATGPTSASKSTVKIGATRDGTIVAAQGTFYLQAGALPGSPIRGAVGCSFSPYDIPHVLSVGFDVLSNRSKVAAYRAPGAPIGAYAVECVLDELASELKMDPLQLRLKNAAKQGTKAAHGPVFPRIGYIETLEAAMAHPHYQAPLGKLQGRGVASGFWFNAGGESSAQVNITEDGNVVVTTGHPDIGGSRAAIANICAELLGIDYRRVSVLIGDTATIGFSNLTGGSRVLFASAMVVTQSTDKIIATLRERAAKIWEIDPDAVKWENGAAHPVEPQRRPVRTADACSAGSQGPADGRTDRCRRATQHGRRGGRLRYAHLRRGGGCRSRDRTRHPLHRRAGRRPSRASELCGGPDAGRRCAGDRLGAERGVHLQPGRQGRQPGLPRLSHAGMLGPADARHRNGRSAEPEASARREGRRRSAARAGDGRSRQRHPQRARQTLLQSADVTAKGTGGARNDVVKFRHGVFRFTRVIVASRRPHGSRRAKTRSSP